jgi:hypothetical protein
MSVLLRVPVAAGQLGPAQCPPVLLAAGAHGQRHAQVPGRDRRVPLLQQGQREGEVGVVVGRVALDRGGELLGGVVVAAPGVVGPAEQLGDGVEAGCQLPRPLERGGGLGGLALGEQPSRNRS